jgi:hypothetical protein
MALGEKGRAPGGGGVVSRGIVVQSTICEGRRCIPGCSICKRDRMLVPGIQGKQLPGCQYCPALLRRSSDVFSYIYG